MALQVSRGLRSPSKYAGALLFRGVRNQEGQRYPSGAILHFDADLDAFAEQTGGVHRFNHAVLSPQYQRNADGSYSNVGAKPAVDVFDGQKWLRSCGAVTNLLPSGSEIIPGTKWSLRGSATSVQNADGSYRMTLGAISVKDAFSGGATVTAVPHTIRLLVKHVSGNNLLSTRFTSGGGGVTQHTLVTGVWTECVHSGTPAAYANDGIQIYSTSASDGVFDVKFPQLTATAYPVPYVPPGVTQPASNATTTNGSWFTLPQFTDAETSDGQWKRDGVEALAEGSIASSYTGAVSGGTISQVAVGVMNVSTSGAGGRSKPVTGFIVGAKYRVYGLARIKSGASQDARIRVLASDAATVVSETNTATDVSFTPVFSDFVATTSTIYVYLRNASAGDCEFSNISIQKLIPATQTSALWKALDGQADASKLWTFGDESDLVGWTAYGCSIAIENGKLKIYNATMVPCLVKRTDMNYPIGTRVKGYYEGSLSSGAGSRINFNNTSMATPSNISNNTWNYRSFDAVLATVPTALEIIVYTDLTTGVAYFDNISIQRIQPQPLTLATRVRMGVGSGDIVGADVNLGVLAELADSSGSSLYIAKKPTDRFLIVRSYDGTAAISPSASVPWSRGAGLRLFTQVNTAGTQFRAGYMIEGTHTAIQWTSWSAFDGSFRPSTLYRLMLGYNNAYPMWFNKITAWKEQVSDARILEAMA